MDITISGLTKLFPPNTEAISDLYLNIAESEFVYLIGTTGSGKTTLLRMLTREVMPTRGQLIIDGQNMRTMSSYDLPYFRRDVGVVFQDYKLLPHLTALENVAFVLEVCGVPPREVNERAKEAIDRVGLSKRRNLMPGQLSGGEQQRVAIARAIVNGPRLFLADEPTGNLDVHTAEQVMRLLVSVHACGTTVIVATHDEHLVNEYRQRVVELHKGRLVSDVQRGEYCLHGDA